MIREIAELTIKPGHEENFERGVAEAAPLFLRAKGCHGLALYRVLETPNVYRLVVDWESVEDHMESFRSSVDFEIWRELVGLHFSGPPAVTHIQLVASYK